MLPLEQSQGLIDQGQNVDSHWLALLLHLNGLVEFLNGFSKILLIKQQLAIVVVDIRHVLEVLDGASECRHGRGHRAHLVLGHSKLNVRVDEAPVKVNGLLVVFGRLGKLPKDEVQLRAVVVDVRVILVMCNCQFEVIGCRVLVAYS